MLNGLSPLKRKLREERGAALAMVSFGVMAIVLMTVLLHQLAATEIRQTEYYDREDTVLAGTEAMLERYATKMTIDPYYYMRFVDEGEAIRRCTDPTSLSNTLPASPGTAWFPDCQTWDYDYTPTFYSHPLLDGDPAQTGDEIEVLLHVSPPVGAVPLEVTVVGRQNGHVNSRSLQAKLAAESVSEFVRMSEGDLGYATGAKTYGKIYVGNNVNYAAGGEAYGNVFAENLITSAPTWMDGAEGRDTTGGHNAAGEVITDVYPDPLNFTKFQDDLAIIELAACGGGGICLDPAFNPAIPVAAQAYLLETVGGGTQLRISYATATPPGPVCQSPEERWWVQSQAAAWTALPGVFDLPPNGALWANQHLVLGLNQATPFQLSGALTVYAGNSSARRNVIFGSDVAYVDPNSSTDVLGVIASDEVYLNPNAVGPDAVLNISGAYLNQNGNMRTALDCGSSGSNLTPGGSILNTYGSNASLSTGNMSCCFVTRNYGFDPRLVHLRPPFFPLLSDKWTYKNWREFQTPCWVDDTC